jgi:AhpC/TSA family protein
MPQLQELWSEIQTKRDDVVFLCVNNGDSAQVINDWWNKDGYTLQAVQQQGSEVSKAFKVRYYPTNYLIDADGKVLYRKVMFDRPAISQKLKK